MRLALVLWLVAAPAFAATRVALTTSTRVGLSEKVASELLARLEAGLALDGLTFERATQACDGERACLVALAKAHQQDAVVAVALVMSLKSILVDLEAVSAKSGTVLGQANFKLKGPDAPLPESLTVFARGLAEQLALEAKPTPVDAPLQPVLEPTLAPALVLPVAAPSRAPVVITAVGAGVALVAAAVLIGVGASTQAQLPPRDSTLPPLSLERAQQLVDGANGAYTGAAIAGGAAGALGVTALILAVTR
jgi:hypothetical protein